MTTAVDWSGRVGEVWAEEWTRTERAFSGLAPLLERAIIAVAPDRGRFLDIGCGVGGTTVAVARARPEATVLGIDLSPGMVALARERSADLPNPRFECADVLEAVANRPSPAFDLLFSRHGVMFFPDPVAAFRRLREAAAPGAPLVFSCFADVAENPWATLITDAPQRSSSYVPGPFAFADAAAGRDLLRAAGWREPHAEKIAFKYLAGEGEEPVADAAAYFRRIGPAASALRDAPEGERPALLARLTERIAPYRHGAKVAFPAAAWLWSAQA